VPSPAAAKDRCGKKGLIVMNQTMLDLWYPSKNLALWLKSAFIDHFGERLLDEVLCRDYFRL
jgi:hypothetical protein